MHYLRRREAKAISLAKFKEVKDGKRTIMLTFEGALTSHLQLTLMEREPKTSVGGSLSTVE